MFNLNQVSRKLKLPKLKAKNGRVVTTPFTEPIRVLFDLNEVLKESKNKKEVEYDLFLIIAPLFLERCNYNSLIEYVTIWKLKG
jgi:hypothetical protein